MQLFHGTENESIVSWVCRNAEQESGTGTRKGVWGQFFFRSILSVYLTVTDYFQHVIALHDIVDYFDNKRSVSGIISGAEHELGTTTRRSLSRFKIQGCLCEVLKGVHSAFDSPFI